MIADCQSPQQFSPFKGLHPNDWIKSWREQPKDHLIQKRKEKKKAREDHCTENQRHITKSFKGLNRIIVNRKIFLLSG